MTVLECPSCHEKSPDLVTQWKNQISCDICGRTFPIPPPPPPKPPATKPAHE